MSAKKPRIAVSKGFQGPARSGFGGFTTASSSLSYISEPPDFGTIADPNVVVSLKNLLKKDSTTKAKALDDLLVYVQEQPFEKNGGVEEPILDAWVKLYPRTSIDNSRRVRELSHVVQLELMKSARKRMERRIPKLAGSWLAGTFDKDRVVSRAAKTGLSSFLTTEEKATQFWKKLQGQIIDYALETVRETPDTLSDERSTTKDDAEAKYYRVVGASLSLALNLLEKVGVDDTREQFDEFLGTESVWALAAAEDSWVRGSVYQLAQICLEKHPDLIKPHLPKVGRALVQDALKIKQNGSAPAYVRVLTTLSKLHPEVWGTKKHPLSKLSTFAERGSQGSAQTFWQDLRELIAVLSCEEISVEVALAFLKALRAGISGREEPRAHAPYSWGCYLGTFSLFLGKLSPSTARAKFVEEAFYPLTEQYLHPVPESSGWTIPEPLTAVPKSWIPALLPKAWATVVSYDNAEMRESFEKEWQRLAGELATRMANSLPQKSEGFQASQQAVADEGERFYSIIGILLREVCDANWDSEPSKYLRETLQKVSDTVVHKAVELLRNRNFKPFGAAAVLAAVARYWLPFLENDRNPVITSFFTPDEPRELDLLLSSPAAPYLLSCLVEFAPGNETKYAAMWRSIADSLIQGDGDDTERNQRINALTETPVSHPLAQDYEPFQEYLITNSLKAMHGETTDPSLLQTSLSRQLFTEGSFRRLAGKTIDQLEGSSASAALKALQLLLQSQTNVWQDEQLQRHLFQRLLLLEDSDDADAGRLASTYFEKLRPSVTFSHFGLLVRLLQENLDRAGPDTLKVDTVTQEVKIIVAAKTQPGLSFARSVSIEELFPNTNVWMEELGLLLQVAPDPSLSLTSSLGGAYQLVKAVAVQAGRRPQRDREGFSIPARMALYTLEILNSGVELSSLPQKFQAELLYCFYLVTELAEDQLICPTAPTEGRLWVDVRGRSTANTRMEEFVSSARQYLTRMARQTSSWDVGTKGELLGNVVGEGPSADLVNILLQQAKGLSAMALYSAKALAFVLEYFAAVQQVKSVPNSTATAHNVWKATPDTVFTAVAFMAGLGDRLHGPNEQLDESSIVGLLCNRLVSDITGSSPGESALMNLVLLNSCFSVFGTGRKVPVNERRQIFAVKQIVSWMGNPEKIDSRLAAELCKALQTFYRTVPSGQDSEVVIDYCISLWENEQLAASLPCLHASLKLMLAMESIPEKFPERNNEDLVDALKTHAEARSQGLINLLQLRGDAGAAGAENQPAEIVEELLCRCVARIPLEHIKDLSQLYGYVASDSKKIQTAAFGLLHKALPAAVSQANIDVLLEKQDAQFPEELLSLLLDAPTYDAFSDDVLAQFPSTVRSYLLSWLLVFDAFEAASLKVRNDYSEALKSNNILDPLMKFMFEVLGHSDGRPLNLEKAKLDDEHIRSYSLEEADTDTPEHDLQWLLVHLFYLTLKYIPGLFKTWFLDCPSKPIKLAVEPWMTKYFSPLIIEEHLADVKQWADNQEEPAEDEKELRVVIWNKGREVLACYEVDEQDAIMCIKIGAGYPLESVSVTSKNRVAVGEKKWQSWLMIIQGVITFNGSIIDGLVAFRRNMVGALKGQTECAICYSIISTDNKMPDKRCGTCKNLFHRVCLYKWFQTSSQNTCPLCRNPIDYLGADTQKRGARAEY